jgi:GAF domain-containing protein
VNCGTVSPPVPANEVQRLEILRSYEVLDTLPELAFDDITNLASRLCGVPIALITLVDAQRQWFKSKVGLTVNETPREQAFCAYAILGRETLVVPDALADPRFAENPLVKSDPHIRFYAGVPLVTPTGFELGTLCVIDHQPRQFAPEAKQALEALARQAMTQLELRRALVQMELTLALLDRAENEQRVLVHQYRKALGEIKTLNGLLPICATCRKIRDDEDYWRDVEAYLVDHSEADFSRGICPECRQHQLEEDLTKP